jgi:hypothetical protein
MEARSLFSKFFIALAVIAIGAAIPSAVSAQDSKGVKFNVSRPDPELLPSSTLTISQVFGGGGGATGTYSADYIEIRNISSTPQSLDTLRLMYGSATGQFGSSAANIISLPAVTLQPGQYFLVQAGTVGTGPPPVPSPDLINASMNLSGASGKIALVTAAFLGNSCGATGTPCTLPDPNIIDLIAYGATNNGEGGTLANNGVALVATQGVIRKLGGCRDTDNNNNDTYIVTNPIPKNSTSGYTRCGQSQKPPVDFNGDGLTDLALVRPGPGGLGGQLTFYNRTNENFFDSLQPWGLNSDFVTPGDYDGDGKADFAVWRQASGTSSGFYILRSSDSTAQYIQFGQAGDDPFIVRDYDGDGKADPAIYRQGSTPTSPSTFWYFSSISLQQRAVSWGLGSDSAVPGDYDGDGKADYGVIRDVGAGQMVFIVLLTGSGTAQYVSWGLATDNFVPGDYDGDGKTDLAVTRNNGGSILWIIRPSTGAPVTWTNWGIFGTDYEVQGDYDGDGRTDIGVWRPSTTPNQSAFYFLRSTGGFSFKDWGISDDIPTGYDVH